MGKRDSSITRVAPVFDELRRQSPPNWVRRLIELPEPGKEVDASLGLDPTGKPYWHPIEKELDPPPCLLRWLVENWNGPHIKRRLSGQTMDKREKLLHGDETTIREALSKLEENPHGRAWYVLEGPTRPDVYIETLDAIVVVEGKRTELGPTTHTDSMEIRHQIWRHIDCAWEIRGDRKVYGFFIVEGEGDSSDVPKAWTDAYREAVSPEAVAGSFPHRSARARAAIAQCFLGATTWQAVCGEFGLDRESVLMDEVPE
jgi:hypothetical protein